MRRSARSLLAVAVGFAGATAVFQAAGVDPLGGIGPVAIDETDMSDHCRDVYGPTSVAFLAGASAAGWRCSTRENNVFRLVEIDFDSICTGQFGDSMRANNTDPADPYSWECAER